MIRKLLVVFCFVAPWGLTTGHAQSTLDSLFSVIDTFKKGNVAVPSFARALSKLTSEDLERAGERTIEALSGEPSDFKIDALVEAGRVYQDRKLIAWAIRFYKEANRQAEKLKGSSRLAQTLERLASVYYKMGIYVESLRYTYDAVKIYENEKKYGQAMTMLVQAQTANYKSSNFSNSVFDFEECLRDSEKLPADSVSGQQKFMLMSGWNTVGLAQRKLKNFEKSMQAFEVSLQLAKEMNNIFWIGLVNGNKGQTLLQMGKPMEAIPHLKEDLRISIRFKEYGSASMASANLAEIYIQFKDVAATKKYLDTANYYLSRGRKESLSGENLIYLRAKSTYFVLIKDFEKAHQTLVRQNQLADSVREQERAVQMAQIQAEYNLAKKESEIRLLGQNNELQRKQIDVQRKLIVATVAFGTVGLGFLVYFIMSYRNARKKSEIIASQRHDIEEKNSELEAQSQTLLKQNEEIEKKNTELEAQSFKLMQQNEIIIRSNQDLETKVSERTSQLEEKIQELDTFLYHASHDIRRPISTLLGLQNLAHAQQIDTELFTHVATTARDMDNMLFKLQMAYRINQVVEDWQNVNLKNLVLRISTMFETQLREQDIDFIYDENQPAAVATSPSMLMVALQNLIENAIQFKNPDKSSKAWIRVFVDQTPEAVRLFVEDNGIGIEEKHLNHIFDLYYRATDRSKGNGVGMYLVKKSLLKINGEITVKSTFGKGTTFTISISTKS